MIKKLKIKNSSGDTIVEVLIVLAVLSLAFAISYTTASRALNGSRNAQEHSETQNTLNSQIEQLRSAYSSGATVPEGPPFCMKDGAVVNFPTGSSIPASASLDTFTTPSAYPTDCVNGFYHYSIVYTGATPTEKGYFDVRVRWDGPGSTGRQQVQTSYKTYKPTGDSSSGTTLSASPTSINVTVKKIPPRPFSNRDSRIVPSCSDDPSADKGGTSITLTGPNGYSVNGTTAPLGSNINFSNLTEYGNYTATITNLPNGYAACPPPSKDVNGATGTNNVQMVIMPTCPKVTIREPPVDVYRTEYEDKYTTIAHYYLKSSFLRTDYITPNLSFSDPNQPVITSIFGSYWYQMRFYAATGSLYDIFYTTDIGPLRFKTGFTEHDVFDHTEYPVHDEWQCAS